MKRKNYISVLIIAALLATGLLNVNVSAENKEGGREYLKLEVNGLACPFCAYGLEKKLREYIDGMEDLDINIEKGYVTFSFPKENKPSEKKLLKIVEEAGFQADKIYFSDKPFPVGEDEK